MHIGWVNSDEQWQEYVDNNSIPCLVCNQATLPFTTHIMALLIVEDTHDRHTTCAVDAALQLWSYASLEVLHP